MAVYGWIGLGNMGVPMTANLVAAGHTVQGYDLDPESLDQAEANGVRPMKSISEVVQGVEVVFTMLPKGEHVRSVFEDPGGILDSASTDTLLVDSSTVDLETSRWCHDQAAERGFTFVDAPVSGGVSGAAAGTLAFMIGGHNEDATRTKALVEPMAGKAFVAGGATTGIAAKLANNMMLNISLLAAAEGSQLAKELGLDAKVFWDITSASSGQSWAQQTWYPVPDIIDSSAANNNFEATFSADLANKDVNLAVEAGEAAGLNLPAAQLARSQLQHLIEEGLGGKDCSLITKYVRNDEALEGYIQRNEP